MPVTRLSPIPVPDTERLPSWTRTTRSTKVPLPLPVPHPRLNLVPSGSLLGFKVPSGSLAHAMCRCRHPASEIQDLQKRFHDRNFQGTGIDTAPKIGRDDGAGYMRNSVPVTGPRTTPGTVPQYRYRYRYAVTVPVQASCVDTEEKNSLSEFFCFMD